jgi:hypothetical protein
MLDDGKLFRRTGPDALGGRIGRLQLGMIVLDCPQLEHKLVVFGIGDLGRVENVVAVIVVVDLLAQLFGSRLKGWQILDLGGHWQRGFLVRKV